MYRGRLGLSVPACCLQSPTGQKGPIGLLQIDGIPHRRCPPVGSGIAATAGTDHLAATAPVGRLNNGGAEHGPLGLNVPRLPRYMVKALPESIFVPALTYGHELWVVTERTRSRVQAAEISFLRGVAGLSLRGRVRSSVIREELGVDPLLLRVERSQMRWLGHLVRMPPGRLPGEVFRARPTGRRPRGRPRTRWRDYSFLSLVNLLSSTHSVWELLGGQPLPQKPAYSLREVPSSIADLIDRLIAVDSEAKINSLFNYEQSHTFGLRLLSVLCCNLDSFLLLESQYAICSMLLLCQKENVTEPASAEGEPILDSLSVERNHVLVRVCAMGGPSERKLPPRALQEGPDPYPWPMFLSYPSPPPQCYTLGAATLNHSKQDSEISAFLASSTDPVKEERWMAACRKQYCKAMSTTPNSLTGTVLSRLLEKVVSVNTSTNHFFASAHYKAKESSVKSVELSSVQRLGINICVRYGRSLGLLKEECTEELALLLKHTQLFLSAQQASVPTHPSILIPLPRLRTGLATTYPETERDQSSHQGQDWLAATMFLIMAGDVNKTLCWLVEFSSLLCSAFLWPARMHNSSHLSPFKSQVCGWVRSSYHKPWRQFSVSLTHSSSTPVWVQVQLAITYEFIQDITKT
ncbi:Protein broad-minded [Merluccius polli]|uniref:Protein broad-minded n=1 Tax=Merluccius polli TaxID=89951 RepID=A0AA47P359_MERPO|nr:Protein broad-minded [Merluccius polli]